MDSNKMRYVYHLTWNDGCNLGYFSSKKQITDHLEDLLSPIQYSLCIDLILVRHGVNEHAYKEYKVRPHEIGEGFYIVPKEINFR